MIDIRIVLEEESGGHWRMSLIRLNRDGRRLLVTCGEEAFPSRAQAEENARRLARSVEVGNTMSTKMWT